MKVSRVLVLLSVLMLGLSAQADFGIVETDDGPIYASIGRQQGDEYIISYNRVVCKTFWGAPSCSRSSQSFRSPVETVSLPIDSISVTTQGVTRTLASGQVFLGRDERMYIVRNVFDDGRIAAMPVEINPSSRFRENGSFAPIREENPQILTTQDVRAMQVRCFLGICEGNRYEEIGGAPLCDMQNLRGALVVDQVVQGIPERLICGRDRKAPILAVFSDGTLANFDVKFNPFPSTIDRYYRVTEEHGALEEEATEVQL